MSWAVSRIDEIAEVVTKGTTPTTYGMPFTDSGVNFIKAEALNGDSSLDNSGFAFVSESTHERLKRSILAEGDILVTIAGAQIGRCGIVRAEYLPANTNQAVGIIRVLRERANPRFVYYFFKNPQTFRMCQGIGGQAAQPNINLTVLKGFDLPLPDLRTQDAIVEVLSAYDDLIENNRRRIALLEEAARLLYREWFVRFPGHEHVKIIDGIPEGWQRFALSDLADFINGYPFKPTHLGDFGLPIVKIPELKHGVTEKTPRNPGDLIPEKYHLKDGDLLFSWSGTLAANVWASGPALLNQHLFHVIPRNRVSRGFLLCALHEALADFNNQTVGATMKHIRRSALDQVFVALPDRAKTSMVEDVLKNTYTQLLVLHQHNRKLAQARDLLLPRLMNGEIAV